MKKGGSDFSRRAVAIFFAVLLIAGVIAGLDYGKTTDEGTEYAILESNAAEYACRLLGENSSIARRLTDGAVRISESIERDHGVSAYYPFYPISVMLNRISPHALSLGWHAYTFLWFIAGCAALYGIARALLGASRKFSCAAVLMLYLTPRMFASGHFNNKDMVLLSLFLIVIYFGVKWIGGNRMRDGISMALFGAFAANTKILGAWCFGAMGVAYLISHIANRTLDKRAWKNGIAAIAVFFAGYALLTPAMWGDPVGYVRYVVQYAKEFTRLTAPMLFEGKIYRPGAGDALPWYYLPKLMAMSIPIYIQLLSLVGAISAIARSKRPRAAIGTIGDEFAEWTRARLVLLVALIALVPILYAVVGGMVLYSGWRHFYFSYASMIVLAVYGLHALIGRFPRGKKAISISVAAAMAVNGGIIALTHPLEDSTFNLIASPFAKADYETDYWLLAARPAMEKIAESGEKMRVTTNFACTGTFANALEAAPTRLRDSISFTWKLSEADCVLVWEEYHRASKAFSDEELAAAAGNEIDGSNLVFPSWNPDGAFEEWFRIDALGVPILTAYRRIK